MKRFFLAGLFILVFLAILVGGAAASSGSDTGSAQNSTQVPASPAITENTSPGNSSGPLSVATIKPVPTQTIKLSPTPSVLKYDWKSTNEDTTPSSAPDDGGDDDAGNTTGIFTGDYRVVSLPGGSSGSENSEGDSSTGGFGGPDYSWNYNANAKKEISNCVMMEKLRETLDPATFEKYNSSGYDLYHPSRAILHAFTPGQYNVMQRAYWEDRGLIDKCYDVSPEPSWDMVTVKIRFMTMNTKPVKFNTTLYVYANSAKIPAISTTDTLDPVRIYDYVVYLPVKTKQVKEIDSMQLDFVQVA